MLEIVNLPKNLRPADAVAVVVLEVQRERQLAATIDADGPIQLEDGRVVLAELRINRPARRFIGVDHGGNRQSRLLEAGFGIDERRRLGLANAVSWADCELQIRQCEIAVGCSARSPHSLPAACCTCCRWWRW